MSVKYRTLGAFVLFAVVVGVWYFQHRERRFTNDPPNGTNIIAFGDSLTAGVGATSGNDYVSVLARMLGRQVLNSGVSGDTTADALRRLDEDVLARDPKIVIIFLGGNDLLLGVPPKAETRKNLEEIIDRIHKQGAAVVLVGIRGAPFRGSLEEVYESLAYEKRVAYVPNALDDIWNRKELMSDPIHPNDRGYAIVAERIASKVREFLHE